jgi:1-deoxy-D-xylulose-5-phosphate synthase
MKGSTTSGCNGNGRVPRCAAEEGVPQPPSRRPQGDGEGDAPLLTGIDDPAAFKQIAVDRLPAVAQEMRHLVCDQVARSGGHLASNLGVVELTLALHYVFDFARDRLLFDVGHQCYPHKLLTGRQGLFAALRTRDGMSGFPEPRESHYDLFSVGHAGTSVATAVGMARGDTLLGAGDRRVVALVGDASIVNGVALEGLNNAGTLERQLLVVLNDNGMSIAGPQGAMARRLARLRLRDGRSRRASGVAAVRGLPPADREALAPWIAPRHPLAAFGLLCLGPVDGHDLPALIDLLQRVRGLEVPVLLHCKTEKGRGCDFATDDPTAFHSPRPFAVNGCRVEISRAGRSFTAAFGDALAEVMARDEQVCAVTAAMPNGTGLDRVAAQFPDRTLDTGICESHAMDMCAGMAKAGVKPFLAVYSTFSQRALDQAFQEVALQGLPVRVCMDRAGYVGGDGAVHHGFMDIALFRPLVGTVLLAASDEPNLRAALEFMRRYDAGPSFVRYPREAVADPPLQPTVPPFTLGTAHLVRPAGERPDLAILALGSQVYRAHHALDLLADEGYDVALYDARFAKPVDLPLLRRLTGAGVPILTVEDHSLIGGFGAAVVEACLDHHLPTERIHRLGMPERWVYQGSRDGQLSEVGLDPAGIAGTVRQILGAPGATPVGVRLRAVKVAGR